MDLQKKDLKTQHQLQLKKLDLEIEMFQAQILALRNHPVPPQLDSRKEEDKSFSPGLG
jgi:hypothetical protein